MNFSIFILTVLVFDYVQVIDITDKNTKNVLNSIAKDVSYIIIDCRNEVSYTNPTMSGSI